MNGTSDGSLDHRNNRGWLPSIHWNGVRPLKVVINLHIRKLFQEVPEYLVHEILEYRGAVDQAIQHNPVQLE